MAKMALTTDFKIQKLNGANYRDWTFNMRLYLESLDLFEHVDGSAEVPAEDASEKVKQEFKSASKKAWTYICLGVEPDQQIHVRNTTTAKEAWDALKNQFARISISQTVRLRQKYYSSKFQSGGNMLEHMNHLKSLHDQLKEMGVNIDDGELAMTLLGSLPDEFKPLITALDAVGEEKVTFEKVKAMLLNDADRISDSKKVEDAYSAQRPYNRRRYEPKEPTNKGNEVKFSRKFNGTCHNCKEKGHFARDCPKRSNNSQRDGNQSKGRRSASLAQGRNEQDNHNDEAALYISENEDKCGWIIDSGATQHMTFERNCLSNYVEFKKPCTVNLGDNRSILAYGKGTYHVKAAVDDHTQKIALQEVLYLPELENNLLSVNAMVKRGATVTFKENRCEISRNSKILAEGEVQGKLYVLKIMKEHVNVAKQQPNADRYIWHCRFGHLGMNNVNKLIDEGMVSGMDSVSKTNEDRFCEACTKGKQHRCPYPKTADYRASEPFELIHSDVCGPMSVSSLGGSRYYVTFIDDYSRYTFVYFMKNKSEVLEKFKEFHAYAMNVGENPIKILRSDNGGEYSSKEFESFLKSNGIVHQLSVPYNPAQNGVAERMNRTIVESTRSMLSHAQMPNEFWAEAASTSVYVRNRSPTTALTGITPYECLFKKKPDVSNLRVFGCVTYVHIPDNQRKKLDPKSRKSFFVGYPEDVKGYKLYDPISRKFTRSRDVIFLEKKFHDFDVQSSTNFDDRTDSDIPLVIEEILTDGSQEPNKIPNQRVAENVEPNQRADDQQVGATFEETFMNEVRNVDERRIRRPPNRFDEECYLVNDITADINEPINLKEAFSGEYSTEWKKATDSEFNSLIENDTWELVPLPEGKHVVGSKWVFKVKRDENGCVQRYKARLVAQGYTQAEGIDYSEVFSPVVRSTTIRSLLALSSAKNWEVHQMDVKSAFLQGNLEEEVYMRQPDGYVSKECPNHVCKLKKSIYGLKQSARCWNNAIDTFLKSSGYKQMNSDPCLYMKSIKDQNGIIKFVILSIHVDDILLFSNDLSMLNEEKKLIGSKFKIEDMGEVKHILGMLIKRDRERGQMTISQTKYLEGILKRFGMEQCKPVSTPLEPGKHFQELPEDENPTNTNEYQKLIGCLTYVTTATRPDLASAVGILSKFMAKPSKEHWVGAKRVLRYIKGTMNYGLVFDGRSATCSIVGYSDADWANDLDTRRSTSGYAFQINGSTISWCSKRQPCVTRSTTEAEYVALSHATQELVWLRRLLNDIGEKQDQPSVMNEDNQGAIELSKNPRFHNRTKHIDVAYHFIREKVNDRSINVKYCSTDQMLADIMTKSLPRQTFQKFRDMLNVKEI